MTNRREFITLIGGAAAWPVAARAQQSERMRRIGVLTSYDESDPEAKVYLSEFMKVLGELGWTDGRNVRMDVRWAGGSVDRARIDRWNAVYDVCTKNSWSEALFILGRSSAPLATQPWRTFRKMIAELKAARGQLDPTKGGHIAIFFDVMAAIFILWSSIGRDIRRFYDPKMSKSEFEKTLLYYIWGGKESYQIRQELRQRTDTSGTI